MQLLTSDQDIKKSGTAFTDGENHPVAVDDAEELIPHDCSNHVLLYREESVRAEVKCTVAISEGVAAFAKDDVKLGQFLQELVDAKVFTKAEAATELKGKSGPTISKLKKIADHRGVIFHPKIIMFLQPSYSVLYALIQLHEALEEGADKPIDVLHEMLKGHDGPIKRKWLEEERLKLKPDEQRGETKSPRPASVAKDQEEPATQAVGDAAEDAVVKKEEPPEDYRPRRVDSGDDVTSETDDDNVNTALPAKAKRADVVVADAGEPITAALLIVGERDEGLLTHAAQENEWQRVADQMAEDSAVFVFAPLQCLLNISRVIETFDCDRCANIYLLSEPDKLEATKCRVLAIFERGEGVSVKGVPNWTADDTPFVIAEQLLLGVSGRRLQLFADAAVPGWETLAFDDDYTLQQQRRPG